MAGIDNGVDLNTKILSWTEMQSHIHKLSSQFIPDEVNVNSVGARPNGVILPQNKNWVLTGGRDLAAWTRTDMSSRTRRTTVKFGDGMMWLLVSPQMLSTERSSIQSWHEILRDLWNTLRWKDGVDSAPMKNDTAQCSLFTSTERIARA